MGIIKKTFYTTVLTGTAFVGYVAGSTSIIRPLPRDDPLWKSNPFHRYNVQGNPSTQDVCIKRVPLSKIRPELLEKDGDLALEFCRGVWAGWGYGSQRRYLAKKYQDQTPNHLWSPRDLATSNYEPGTHITDHFEVVERTPSSITVRCGDSPVRNPGPRESDGLFVMYAEVDKERGEVELGLKSCFFDSKNKNDGILGPMPKYMETAHQWYSRLWMVSASRWVTKGIF
ncbi:hypothetical protein Daus18300_005079 [Diaporthe australafricana]|uniref:Uncharacterized protein n=1 Tax=Diaporthe australafricana TaxID=127596 RepID=A0ABR3X484_9PEZI